MTPEYIWQDRKHCLGLPIGLTRYALSEDRIICTPGLAAGKCDWLPVSCIADVQVRVSLWQHLFGTGTLTLICDDEYRTVMKIHNIKHPFHVAELIRWQTAREK